MKIKGKRIFITGGAGFIGSSLAERLINDNEIVLYDNFSRDALSRKAFRGHKNLTVVRGDVRDEKKLAKSMKGADMLVHLAAIAGVDTVLSHKLETLKTNIIGTYSVLEAAAKLKRLERFIDFSTSEVFGAYAFKVDELQTTSQGSVGEARWCYAVAKLAGEHFVHAYHETYGLPAVTIRPFNVYGPGQVGDGAIKNFIERALRGKNLVINGDGSQIRAWCYIDDCVDGILLCLENKKAAGETFNIGNPKSVVTVYQLAAKIISLSGMNVKIEYKPAHSKDIEIRIPNIDKARQLLGYEPKIELDEGIVRALAWYKGQMEVGKRQQEKSFKFEV